MRLSLSGLTQVFTKQFFTAARDLFFIVFRPLGESRHSFVQAFLYGFVRPLWNFLPDLSSFTVVTKVGPNFVKFRPFIMHDFLFVLAEHEPIVKSVFQPKPGQVVVDAGAHIGLYSLKAAKLVGSKGCVIAIEPDPRNYCLLRQNIALNKLKNVITINVALSDTCGLKRFYTCSDPSLSGFQPPSGTKICSSHEMKFVTLTSILKDFSVKEVNWLKIDVEGEELKVLQGGLSNLKNSVNIHVLIESDDNKAAKLLEANGFKSKYLGEIYYIASKVTE